MTLSVLEVLILIVIAAICGAIGRSLAGGTRGGLIVSTALGFIGALVGPWVAGQLHLAEPLMLDVGGKPFPIVWSIIGGVLFSVIISLLTRPRRVYYVD